MEVDRSARRILVLLLLLIIGLLLIAGRLVSIQVVEAARYGDLAREQRLRRLEIPPNRGTIYDRTGQELAVNLEVDTIYATPYLLEDPRAAARLLALILGQSEQALLASEQALLAKFLKRSGFVYLARKVDPTLGQKVRALNLEGIGVLKESKRSYPYDSLGSQVIGLAGMDNQGLAGIELYYDRILRGSPGMLISEQDPQGRTIPGSVERYVEPTNGGDLRLTIDKEVQYQAEVELAAVVRTYKAKAGTIIVMDVTNGEIYALANVPGMNLNKPVGAAGGLRNRGISDLYEPGSTMKSIIASGALEEGVAQPSTKYYLPSTIKVGKKTIKEAHGRAAKTFTFSEIIEKSSNVGAVTIGQKLGRENMARYLSRFGLAQNTGIDLPGEATGYFLPVERWAATTAANVPFGQGICVTPLSLARAYAAVVNGGVLVRPHLLLEDGVGGARAPAGRGASDEPAAPSAQYNSERVEETRVISRSTSEKMRLILEQVVARGTGRTAAVPGYRVGGKTGTAQKPKLHGRGYDPGKYVSSFIGFAPAGNPRLLVFVVVDEPKGGYYGGTVTAPVFGRVMEFALRHLRIPPD